MAKTVTLQTMPPPTMTARTTTTPGRARSLCFYDYIELPKATLSKIDFGPWLQHALEVHVWIWICFTAAAASVFNESDWTSFNQRPLLILTALDSDELPVLKDSWAYLTRLRDVSRGFVHS
jgi:hypothetical protein